MVNIQQTEKGEDVATEQKTDTKNTNFISDKKYNNWDNNATFNDLMEFLLFVS